MLNFYKKFLCGAVGVLAPLTDALKGSGKSLACRTPDSAFPRAKEFLASVLELVHPSPGAQIYSISLLLISAWFCSAATPGWLLGSPGLLLQEVI